MPHKIRTAHEGPAYQLENAPFSLKKQVGVGRAVTQVRQELSDLVGTTVPGKEAVVPADFFPLQGCVRGSPGTAPSFSEGRSFVCPMKDHLPFCYPGLKLAQIQAVEP